MARGGVRPGSGRPLGAATKRTREIADQAAASGLLPLEYMLNILRDPTIDNERRDWAAEKAAPYLHPKLIATTGETKVSLDDPLTALLAQIDANGRRIHD
jgi:hypothetical protein